MHLSLLVSLLPVALAAAPSHAAQNPPTDASACVAAIAGPALSGVAPASTGEVTPTDHGGCHASTDCECGTISCEGQECSADSDSVTCDGVTQTCEPPDGSCSASTSCPDGSFISCSSPDHCSSGTRCTKEPGCWVACDANGDGFGIEDFTWCPGFEGCLTCPCGGWG